MEAQEPNDGLIEEWSDEPAGPVALDFYLSELKGHTRIAPARELVLGKRIKRGQETMVRLVFDTPIRLQGIVDLKEDVTVWLEKRSRPNLSETEAMLMMKSRTRELSSAYPDNDRLAELARRLTRIESRVRAAMDELVTANLRLVIKVAKDYISKGLTLEDLIQEGNLGLIKAAGKYNYEAGNRFSTYAIWWIKQSIMRAVYDKARTIRLPVHLIETRNAYYRAYNNQAKRLNRDPRPAEVAEAMGVSVDKVTLLTQLLKDPVYLDDPMGGDGMSVVETLEADNEIEPLESTNFMQLKSTLQRVLDELPAREASVLKRRFGLENDVIHTLEEVGREFNISRERVRQIENQALARLREPEVMGALKAHF
jgi:RNA polymerase primary sigma factor